MAGNWYNQTTGATATAVPGINDEALVSNASTISGTGNVYDLGLTGPSSGGLLIVAGQFTGTNFFAAGYVGVGGGGSLIFSNIVDIGDYSSNSIVNHVSASVTIGIGGLLRDTLATPGYFGFLIGQSGGVGSLTVAGSGALADAGARGFDVGDAGTGQIQVLADGHITGGTGDSYQSGVSPQIGLSLGTPGGSGMLLVSGSNAGATFGDLVDVGFGGSGTLIVQNGGTLTAGDGAVALNVGDLYGSTAGNGAVTISGATATLNGFTEIGAYGQGIVTLASGASVTMSETSNTANAAAWSALLGIATGASGTLAVDSSAVLTAGHGLGIGVQGHGELDISGGSVLLSSPTGGNALALDLGIDASGSASIDVSNGLLKDVSGAGMVIGAAGSGRLAVDPGGTLIAGAGGITIGQSSGSTGTLAAYGAGATITSLGQLQDGAAGTGTLTVSGGSALTTGSATNAVGLAVGAAGGAGGVYVGDSGSAVTVTGQIGVGLAGSGSILVSAGTISATASGISAVELGGNSGSTGVLTVTGSGGSLVLVGGITAGSSGNGSFTLSAGAHATLSSPTPNSLPSMTLGAFAGIGVATVDGSGTVLSDTGQVLVGGTGTGSGTLTVSGGASFSVANASGQTAPDVVIGAGTGTATSMATVTGAGSALTIAGALLVGHGTHGALTIQNGGSVSAGTVTVSDPSGGLGTLTVSGTNSVLSTGTLQIGTLNTKGAVSIAGGTISVTGAASVRGSLVLSLGGTLTAVGAVTVAGGSTLIGQGTVRGSAIVDVGRLGVNGGTMTVGGRVISSGQISAAGGGNMILLGGEASTVGLVFGTNGTFTTGSVASIAGTITGWTTGDALDFTNAKIASDSLSGNTLSLFDSGNHLLGKEIFAGSVASHNFTLTADHGSGTLLSYHS